MREFRPPDDGGFSRLPEGLTVRHVLQQAGANAICTARITRGHSTQSEVPTTTIDNTVDAIHETGGRAEAIMWDHTDTEAVWG